MKRILSLALICVILAISLAPAAHAAESDDIYFDAMTYTTPNESGSFRVPGSDGVAISDWKLPEGRRIRYVEIIFACVVSDPAPTSVTLANSRTTAQTSLTITHITGATYRAYGEYSSYTPNITLRISSTKVTSVMIESFKICYENNVGFDERGTCEILHIDYGAIINYVPTDVINFRNFTGSSSSSSSVYNLWITCPNWRKYDRLDISFSVWVADINSITVTIGDDSVPYEVSTLTSGNGFYNDYYVTVKIDLSEVRRTTTNELFVHVTGNVNSGSDNMVSIDGMRGFYETGTFDIFTIFFRNIISSLTRIESYLKGDSSSANEFKEESSELISGLDGISASMDSVDRPSMDTINADFTGDISDAAVLMTGLFAEVTGIPWLSTIILASCTLGLISYILYGKE